LIELDEAKRLEKRLKAEAKRQETAERVAFNLAERAEKQAAKLAADELEIAKNLAERASISSYAHLTQKQQNEQQWDDMFEVLVRYIEEIREMATGHMNDEQKAAWIWDGNVPKNYKTPCGKALGRWIGTQRLAQAKDTLKDDRDSST
jgi:hypothetical protein